ncbi:MAG: 3-hydroxyacyl-CoA dehydrogenase NAD-binding domain-containing protein [Pseudomonadota bacterium]
MAEAAVLGGGVIGAGWAARLVLFGRDVRLYDPSPAALARAENVLATARAAWEMIPEVARPAEGTLSAAASVEEAVAGADLIVEAVPERLEVKGPVYAEAEAAAAPDALITSSTSGIKPTDLQAEMAHPERLLVAHPFNPVYLLPLVELVAGARTAPESIDRAATHLSALRMFPLRVRKEIDAFIADRLLEAVWREALWLVKDGVATTEEIDEAIRMGFGLRWAQMGIFETYRIAGGDGGMRHFLAQFGPTLAWPWTKLMDVPELDDALIERIASQSDAQSGHLSIAELEAARDRNLVAILRSLAAEDWGAGRTLTKAAR